MAHPAHVSAVSCELAGDKDRIRDSVGPGRRFPFGVSKTDNANYLWIQLFYSTLNQTGLLNAARWVTRMNFSSLRNASASSASTK